MGRGWSLWKVAAALRQWGRSPLGSEGACPPPPRRPQRPRSKACLGVGGRLRISVLFLPLFVVRIGNHRCTVNSGKAKVIIPVGESSNMSEVLIISLQLLEPELVGSLVTFDFYETSGCSSTIYGKGRLCSCMASARLSGLGCRISWACLWAPWSGPWLCMASFPSTGLLGCVVSVKSCSQKLTVLQIGSSLQCCRLLCVLPVHRATLASVCRPPQDGLAGRLTGVTWLSRQSWEEPATT